MNEQKPELELNVIAVFSFPISEKTKDGMRLGNRIVSIDVDGKTSLSDSWNVLVTAE